MKIDIPVRLQNPLNVYNTYSVAYDIIMTSSLSVAQHLSDPLMFDVYVNATTNSTLAAQNSEDFVPGENITMLRRKPFNVYDVNGNTIGEAVHLIDSTRDADFLVQSFEVQTILNADSANGMNIGTQLEGSLRIHEPRSATFMDLIQRLTTTLKITDTTEFRAVFVLIRPTVCPSNMQLTYTGTSIESNFITQDEIAPIKMEVCTKMMTELSCVFTPSGTDYELSLVGMDNGVAALPNNNTVVHMTNLKLTPNSTLKQAIAAFEAALNETYQRTLPKVSNGNSFSSYEYRIVLDPEYQDPAYAIDNISSLFSQTGKNDGILSFVHGDVTKALLKILTCSSKVLTDADPKFVPPQSVEIANQSLSSEEVADGATIPDLKLYNISKPSVSSRLIHDPQKPSKGILQFYVNKASVPYTDKPSADMSALVQQILNEAEENPESARNIMLYDYIHTGKNVDVRRVELAITNGLAYATSVESTNATNGIAYVNTEPSAVTVNSDSPYMQKVITPQKPSSISNAFVAQESRRRKMYDVLNKFIFPENTMFEIEVTGNPNLYNSYSAQQGMSFRSPEGTLFKNIDKQPSLLFLNIQYPSSPNYWEPDALTQSDREILSDPKTNERYMRPQLVPFWFQAVQQVMSITTVFEGSTFYHTLYVYPLTTAQQSVEKDSVETPQATNGGNNSVRGAHERVYTAALSEADTFKVGGRNFANADTLIPEGGRGFKAKAGTPLKTNYITSAYSIARVTTYTDRKTQKKVTGPRPHKGVDLRGSPGTPVYAIADGVIIGVAKTNKFEVDIITIKHPTGHISRYIHVNADGSLKTGDQVTAGQQIATVASIPKQYNAGPHLHFEIAWKGVIYNPEQFIDIAGAKQTSDVKLYFQNKR